ncbi:MAG: hypothetical protein KatS3mg035_0630 [Bacteroidia bacterium]|nr:MAG: hypothetical protein KatS3mg035_0630 [Bacteroidia bacterium]
MLLMKSKTEGIPSNIYVLNNFVRNLLILKKIQFWGWLMGLILTSPLNFYAQMYFPELKFQKFYGTDLKDQATAMVVGLDSNLYLSGTLQAQKSIECTEGYLLKVSPEGNLLWTRTIGGTGCDEIKALAASPDSTIVFGGISGSTFKHPEFADTLETADFLVGKIDFQGNLVWKKTLGGSYQDIANGIIASPYGGTVTVGSTWSQDFDASSLHYGA